MHAGVGKVIKGLDVGVNGNLATFLLFFIFLTLSIYNVHRECCFYLFSFLNILKECMLVAKESLPFLQHSGKLKPLQIIFDIIFFINVMFLF